MANTKMKIKYWGVRGSIPAPLTDKDVFDKIVAVVKDIRGDIQHLVSEELIREYLTTLPRCMIGTYGGNTTCIEVQAKDSPLIMLDAGSGAREMGNSLLPRIFSGQNLNQLSKDDAAKREVHLLLSHYHWDHLQGFPFFVPAFLTGQNKVTVNFYGKKDTRQRLSEVLSGQQQYPNFPVEWEDMPCDKVYHELSRLESRTLQIGSAKVTYQELNHPDEVFAYRIETNGKSFVLATDTEHRDHPDPRLVKLAKGADILYYDAQYTPDEYKGKKGMPKIDWGHSTYEWGVKNAIAAGVKTLVLGHHDPGRSDEGLEEILMSAKRFCDEQHSPNSLDIVMGYDGLEQYI